MAKLSKTDLSKISAAQERVLFYGTPEKGYADSGLWEFLKHVYTKDAHDPLNPVKRLIGEGDDYIIVVLLYMLHFNDLCIPKSRQIRMSWIAAAFATWHTMSAQYRHTLWQGKKEKNANAMVSMGSKNPCDGRIDFIVQHLPPWLRDQNIVSGKGNLAGSLVFNQAEYVDGVKNMWRGSKIDGIPQGGDQIRQEAPSLVVEDEAAFQDEYMSARIAAKPAVTGGGKMISLSSVDAGSGFNITVLDVDKALKKEIMDPKCPVIQMDKVIELGLSEMGIEWPKGLRTWRTAAGVRVIEINYRADPKKDPEREGAAWKAEAVRGYVGGTESSGWQTEMEINYEAGGGDPVFPQVKISTPIFIDSFKPSQIINRMRFFAGYDYGSSNPSAFEVWGIDEDKNAYAVWELYEPCTNIEAHVAKIKRCPYWDRIEVIACDPSIMSKTQQGASDIKTLSELFEDYGLSLTRGRRGQDVSMALMFNSSYWKDAHKPTAFITKSCPALAQEVMNLRKAKHLSEAVNSRQNAPEKIRQKDNHGWDATATIFDYGVEPFVQAIVQPTAGTYAQAVADLELHTLRERSKKGGINVR